ncbi:MAG: 50S ribosomal protein L10 [Lentisphaerae bacterium RIFOXYB12_FULL_65_16]|nr:MAG: 50S ribosomal protein L10 [Lentisphaerae bacterium RIFOXYA12_64_32]OGV93879.1 MAG: 50S ribosomal protein L10 [Lentisphaerae bacterium RIFOXYB12_FULL_65_16]
MVKDLQALVGPATCLFLTTYKGLKASDFEKLRGRLAKNRGQCLVVPNRLLKRAAAESGLTALAAIEVKGDTLLVCGETADPVAIAKMLKDFAKETPALSFKAGILNGRSFGPKDAEHLATLPAKEVLQAQLLGLLLATPQRLVSVLSAKVASVVYVLEAYRKAKEKAA